MPTKSRKKAATPRRSPRPAPLPAPATSAALTPGTVLRKVDRAGKVRCECTVEAGGYRYKSSVHGSLSAAAAAAAEDIGLSGKSFNGYVFWGLSKPTGRDPLHRVEHLWQRYSNAATELLKGDGEAKAVGMKRVRQHVAQLSILAG